MFTASDTESTLCKSTNPSLCSTYANPELTKQIVQDDVTILAQAPVSDSIGQIKI